MKIHLRFYPEEQNGYVPISVEIDPFKYPFNPLEDRYEYGHFSREEVAKKHNEIIEYISERIKSQPQVAQQASKEVQSEEVKQAAQELKRYIYENCHSWPLAQDSKGSIIRPDTENEFHASISNRIIIKLLAPINCTIGNLSSLLRDYSRYTTYGLAENARHDFDSNLDFDKIGLLAAKSALLKATTAVTHAESYVGEVENKVKFLNGPERYSVFDPKKKEKFVEYLTKTHVYVSNFVEECKQALVIIERIAPQITNTNLGPQSWQAAQKILSRGKQSLETSLSLLKHLENLIENSKVSIQQLLDELSADPAKQEQVKQWLEQERLKARKNKIYSRLNELQWQIYEKTLPELESAINECNIIIKDIPALNITGTWARDYQLFIERAIRTKIEKISNELVFFEQIDFSQKSTDELLEIVNKFASLMIYLRNTNATDLQARSRLIEEKINQRDIALQIAANKLERLNKELEVFEQIDFSKLDSYELCRINAELAYLIQQNNPEFDSYYARYKKIKEKIKEREAVLQLETLPKPLENNNTDPEHLSSNLSSDQHDHNNNESSNQATSLIKTGINFALQFIFAIFSLIKFILSYPLSWIDDEPQQPKQESKPQQNKPSKTTKSKSKQDDKRAVKIQPTPTFTPLMLAKAQQELATKNPTMDTKSTVAFGLRA